MAWEYLATIPVVLGMLVQRITGLGFALLAAPAFVLMFGPDDGVLLVNFCGIFAAGVGALIDGRRAEWRRLALLLPTAVVGVLAGAAISTLLPRAVLEVAVGSVLLLGLASLLLVRRRTIPTTAGATAAAGASAGLGGALAGLPGPPIALYAGATGWRGPAMSATLQVLFLTTAATAFALKLATGAAALPSAGTGFWVAIATSLALGIALGLLLGPRVPPVWPWRIVVVLAVVGAVSTIVHGAIELATPVSATDQAPAR